MKETNPIERLKAVLCDPHGKCCISGSDADRKVIDDALDDLKLLIEKYEKVYYLFWSLKENAGRSVLDALCDYLKKE